MKLSKTLLTLLSVATIGLSSSTLMAEGDQNQRGDQLMQRLRDHVNIEITPELQAMIDAFRADRQELMAQFRELRQLHRESMGPLWMELKKANELGNEDAIADAKAAIKKAHEEFRAEYGGDLREARQQFRALRRQFRENLRDKQPPVVPEG